MSTINAKTVKHLGFICRLVYNTQTRQVWPVDQCGALVSNGNGRNYWIFSLPDEVNLRLIHIRQTEVLFYANNYHLPNYQQTKDGRATDSCFALIGIMYTADS